MRRFGVKHYFHKEKFFSNSVLLLWDYSYSVPINTLLLPKAVRQSLPAQICKYSILPQTLRIVISPPKSGRMKQRFSSIDVKVICQELNTSVIGLRVSNIYDLSSVSFSKFPQRMRTPRTLIFIGMALEWNEPVLIYPWKSHLAHIPFQISQTR